MERRWKYLDNQFAVTTLANYMKAVKISNYHDADLNVKKETEPLLVPIYDRYHPLHLNLVNEYNTWKGAGGSQEGQTLNVEQLLEQSYLKIAQWDVMIQVTGPQFFKGTPNYLALFTNGRNSFSKGTIDGRINAYDTLAKNMMPFAPLSTIMAQVADTYTDLDKARDAQLGAKGTVMIGSGKVEAARVIAMTMQWRNLGFAMDAFFDKPKYIESMFDLTTVRDARQRVFTGTLDPAENEAILINTFESNDQLRLRNKGNTEIFFYLATTANGLDSTVVKVQSNTTVVRMISDFGTLDLATHRFLTAVNQDPNVATQYEVEIL